MITFAEAPDTAVITTKYVVRQQSPILFVFHFEDGFWQFAGQEEQLLDADYLVLRLDEIIALDPSILEVADLPLGVGASRMDKGAAWTFSKLIDA
jgi:hypothetical protein